MTDSGDAVRIAPSPIEGLGVLARDEFEAGAAVLSLDTSREVTADAPLRPEAGEREDHVAHLDGRAYLLPDPERRLNHSCDPNAFLRTVDDRVCVVARRTIEPGEEVTIDYLINTHDRSSWRCSCASDRCRGTLEKSFFDLPADLQREYLPLLEDWFVEAHRSRIERLHARLHTDS